MKINHDPSCSKPRQTLGYSCSKHSTLNCFYFEVPPTKSELQDILKKLGRNVSDILRKGEADYKAHFTAVSPSDEAALLELLVAYPKVIERPIVVAGSVAVIGRPPEAVFYSKPNAYYCMAKEKIWSLFTWSCLLAYIVLAICSRLGNMLFSK